eukprot:TRINITY_DN11330_c1_g1_i2.p1 TRINITY_DN11330_c1_g1~~TRINITY_DN11330_c1_g1_i2.p1  ORF type:complete len:239 (-),score=44.22 TRINITY_DN11330_c1_g1_i2:256-900(-)
MESPSGSQSRRSAEMPGLQRSFSTSCIPAGSSTFAGLGARAVAAGGSGCYHYMSTDHHVYDSLHEASETRKLQQRRDLQADQKTISLIKPGPMMHSDKILTKRCSVYDINGKVYAQGLAPTAPPRQMNKHHWLCQVNGMTSAYNVINNQPLNPAIDGHRKHELQRLSDSQKSSINAAGDVQPQRPIKSDHVPGYVAIRCHQLPGQTERHGSLFS